MSREDSSMSDFSSILAAAQGLPEQDRLRLIGALWDTLPPDLEAPFSDEWAREIERRAAELDAGTARTIPWSHIRDEALGRTGHGKGD
jgi:putative addiction module component (TIGR02574 family)